MKKKETRNAQQDIISFLENKRGFYSKYFSLPYFLRTRIWSLIAMFKGYFNFYDFLRLIAPARLSNKYKLMGCYFDSLATEMLKNVPHNADGSVDLLGNKFSGINFYETVDLVNGVILADQYGAAKFLKSDSVVIDAGANIGVFSIFAANLSPAGKIYSFEPVYDTFKMLKSNTYNYPQIDCLNLGLGNSVTEKQIFSNKNRSGLSAFEDASCASSVAREGAKRQLSGITTIDEFIFGQDIPRVDFIKIDTEGYEENILRGATKTIQRDNPVISMSAYHNKDDKQRLPQTIKQFSENYICELHKKCEECFICYIKDKI
jgi:FkbM family methyltransferase